MEPILQVENLVKTYTQSRKKTVIAVNHISFAVDKGEVFGLLGPNGAGKTSTIKCICGLLQINQGDVWVKGYSMKKERNKGLRHISAVLEGNRNIYWRMTVEENLAFFTGINGYSTFTNKSRVDYLLKQFQLEEQRKIVVNKLSRGMKQKVALAISLITDKEIILLDEPTLGLDVGMSIEMRSLLRKIAKEEGKTILLSTHDMNVVEETCDRLVIINKGKLIAQDTIKNMMNLRNQEIYLLQLEGKDPTAVIESVKHIVEVNEWKQDPSFFTLRITLTHPNKLYTVMECLKAMEVNLVSIQKSDQNLEDIFMKLIQEDNIHEVSL